MVVFVCFGVYWYGVCEQSRLGEDEVYMDSRMCVWYEEEVLWSKWA